MLATQCEIDVLSARLESAYRRLRPSWDGHCSSSRVWDVAAMKLVDIHHHDPSVPIDPELFVASQPKNARFPEPWRELTRDASAVFYVDCVLAITIALHHELAAEVRKAEERIRSGQALSKVLISRSRRLSPLGKYIVAKRAGRDVLSRRFVPGAIKQHLACPLYRPATLGLISPASYPALKDCDPPKTSISQQSERSRSLFHLN